MFRQMLRSKIHRATVTGAHLEYEGSLTIDEDLMEAAAILPYEAIICSNMNNGERFMTYAIGGPPRKRGYRVERPDGAQSRGRRSDHHFLLRVLRRGRNQKTCAEDRAGQRQESDRRVEINRHVTAQAVVVRLQKKFTAGEVTATEIVRAYSLRIGQVEPKVKAYVTQTKDAALAARRCTGRRG